MRGWNVYIVEAKIRVVASSLYPPRKLCSLLIILHDDLKDSRFFYIASPFKFVDKNRVLNVGFASEIN